MTAYHVIIGVVHVVHVIIKEMTGRNKICIHCFSGRGKKCVYVCSRKVRIERQFTLKHEEHIILWSDEINFLLSAITSSEQAPIGCLLRSSHLPLVVVSEPEFPSICSPEGCVFILAVFSVALATRDTSPPSVPPKPVPSSFICLSGSICFSSFVFLFSVSTSSWAGATSLGTVLLFLCSKSSWTLWLIQAWPAGFLLAVSLLL